MKLPTLDAYAFPVVVPSTGKNISMRPFLVREEKLLLMSQESSNPDEQIEAIAQIIRNCTNEEIEPRKVAYFDIEYLLLQLRARSVSELITPVYECNQLHPQTQEPCKHRTEIPINLNDIPAPNVLENNPLASIDLSSRYTLKLRYPTIFTINNLLLSTLDKKSLMSGKSFDALCDIFSELVDNETDTIFDFNDYNEADKIEFLNNLAPADYEKLVAFIQTMPSVYYETTYTCEKCQFKHNIILAGILDFLG